MHRTLEDEVPQLEAHARTRHAYLFNRLSTVTQEYTLLQIAKLHDPAVQQKSINLSIAYMLDYGAWDSKTRGDLEQLKSRLDALGRTILATPRNKLLCHNDLATILSSLSLGAFSHGSDADYFEVLKQFASIVHDRVVGEPYVFGEEAATDVKHFLIELARPSPALHRRVIGDEATVE